MEKPCRPEVGVSCVVCIGVGHKPGMRECAHKDMKLSLAYTLEERVFGSFNAE